MPALRKVFLIVFSATIIFVFFLIGVTYIIYLDKWEDARDEKEVLIARSINFSLQKNDTPISKIIKNKCEDYYMKEKIMEKLIICKVVKPGPTKENCKYWFLFKECIVIIVSDVFQKEKIVVEEINRIAKNICSYENSEYLRGYFGCFDEKIENIIVLEN